MNKATKVTGFALASAAALLLVTGCAHNANKSTDKESAKVAAKSTNSCNGKSSCKSQDSCKGKNSCKGK